MMLPPSAAADAFVATSDASGWQFRPPENGHVVRTVEVVNKIVPYYELFITNAFVLGYHVLTSAKANSKYTYTDILLKGCDEEHVVEDFDLCATSHLVWGLIGGALIYFVLASLVALGLAIECRRKGYPGLFTGLWHSPWFVFCLFFSP